MVKITLTKAQAGLLARELLDRIEAMDDPLSGRRPDRRLITRMERIWLRIRKARKKTG